jgi:predicted metal-binding membrane protein
MSATTSRRAPVGATTTRWSPIAGLVVAAAGAAWLWVLLQWGDVGAMPGTMGRNLPAFDGMWTVMMAAMMLPATAPIASVYARSINARRLPRMAGFTCGYLLVWAAAGLPAYALAVGAGHAAGARPAVGTAVAAAIFALNGAYQLSPWKDRCLARCRTPIGLLLRYASWRGPSRHLRAGAHHGAFCLACCSTLMALLAAFGVMNLWATVGLTFVVAVEKAAPVGPVFARLVGVASLMLAVAVFWEPASPPA